MPEVARVTQCEENTHLAARWTCEQSEKIMGKYINDQNFKLQMHERGSIQCKIEGGTPGHFKMNSNSNTAKACM